MKLLVALMISLFALTALASEKMGREAVEMFAVLSHPQVVECLRDVPKMVNVSIEKMVARCPGCNTYKISGNELGIDIARPEKTVMIIKGRSVPGTFGGFIQTYTCEVKNP